MKQVVHCEVCINENPVSVGRKEHTVNVTHLLNDPTSEQVKCKILDTLADEKGRLEVKNGTVVLCFWNLKDKEDFLGNLQ
ncbi:MAG: hypothetical protein ACHQYP_05325 [Nitrospiria bacterium]